MTTPADIVAEARSWVGTRWIHQARVKGVGTDCIGLVAGVALALNLPRAAEWHEDQRFKSYGRTPDPVMMLAGCRDYMDEVAVPGIGDVLIMRAFNVQEPTHFAIVSGLDPMYMIHSRLMRKVSENRVDDRLASLILYAFRYRL